MTVTAAAQIDVTLLCRWCIVVHYRDDNRVRGLGIASGESVDRRVSGLQSKMGADTELDLELLVGLRDGILHGRHVERDGARSRRYRDRAGAHHVIGHVGAAVADRFGGRPVARHDLVVDGHVVRDLMGHRERHRSLVALRYAQGSRGCDANGRPQILDKAPLQLDVKRVAGVGAAHNHIEPFLRFVEVVVLRLDGDFVGVGVSGRNRQALRCLRGVEVIGIGGEVFAGAPVIRLAFDPDIHRQRLRGIDTFSPPYGKPDRVALFHSTLYVVRGFQYDGRRRRVRRSLRCRVRRESGQHRQQQ